MKLLSSNLLHLAWILLLAVTASACTNSSDCSNQGVCNSNSVCECNVGHLGPACEYPTTNIGTFGLKDEHVVEWLVQGSVVRTRFTWKDPSNYFSIIFEPGPDGMSSGDCWVWGLQSGVMVVEDRYSSGLNTPNKDATNDLVLTASRVNATHQVAESTRNLTTSESNDQQILNQSYFLRMSWTIGNAGIPAASSGSSGRGKSKDLGMHKLLDGTGLFSIDFVGGRYVKLASGVKWPNLYYAFAAVLGASLALAIAFNALKYARSRVAQCLRATAFWEISRTELIIWGLYLGGLIAGCIVSNQQYVDIGRYPSYMIGHLATIHLAFAILPVSRHSILLRLLGIDYDRSIAWHRWVSRTAILLCWAHGVAMIIPWKISGLFFTGDVQWGFGSIFGLGGTLLFSAAGLMALPYFRRGKYEVFLWSHRVLIPFGYVMCMLHAVQLRWLMIVPGALYIIDNLLRFFTLLLGKANVLEMQQFTDGDMKAVILKLSNRRMFNKYSPGSFVFMYVPGVSAFQWHPFSISSAASPEEDGVFTVHVLAMKPNSWTDRLYAFAPLAQQRKAAKAVVDGANQDPLQVSVFTEGPFSTNDLPIARFPVVVLVGGGVGVSPLMSFFSHFVQQYDFDNSVSKKAPFRIHLIWASRSRRALTEWFTPVLRRALSKYPQNFTVQLFHTGNGSTHPSSPSQAREIEMIQAPSRPAGPVSLPGAAEDEGEGIPASPNNGVGNVAKNEVRLDVVKKDADASDQSNIDVSALIQRGRPDIPSIFAKIRDQAGVPAHNVAVAVCGPSQLEKDVDKVATEQGFFCHKEGFLM